VADKKDSPPAAQLAPTKQRGKRRSQLMAVRYHRPETNGDVKSPCRDEKAEASKESVKMERLSPNAPASALTDHNSNSSRSCTPSSSYPSTPPDAPSHLKQMEQMMMARNYSEFMRNLAAKYNHANPNE